MIKYLTIKLYDNQVAIAIIKNDDVGPRGKDMELQYHNILDMVQNNELHVNYIPTKEMLALIL